MSWKSTEQVHREGTKGCKQDRRRVSATVCRHRRHHHAPLLVNWLGSASVARSDTRPRQRMADAIRILITACRLPHPRLPLFTPHQWEQEWGLCAVVRFPLDLIFSSLITPIINIWAAAIERKRQACDEIPRQTQPAPAVSFCWCLILHGTESINLAARRRVKAKALSVGSEIVSLTSSSFQAHVHLLRSRCKSSVSALRYFSSFPPAICFGLCIRAVRVTHARGNVRPAAFVKHSSRCRKWNYFNKHTAGTSARWMYLASLLQFGLEPPAVGTSHTCANGGLRLFV